MKNLRVNLGGAALVSYIDKNGDRVIIPLVKMDSGWRNVGVYLKTGASQSDPSFAQPFPIPYNWEPPVRIRRAIKRAEENV